MLQLGQHGLHAMKASPHRPPLCREHNPGASCALERRSRGAPEWKNSPSDTAIGRAKQCVQHPLPGLAAGTRGLPLRWLSRCALTRASIPRASIPRAELGPAAPGEKTRRLPWLSLRSTGSRQRPRGEHAEVHAPDPPKRGQEGSRGLWRGTRGSA